MVLQETNKLVVMGHINFEDHVLIEKGRAGKKMNASGRMFKDKKNGVIIKRRLRLLFEVVCVFEVSKFTTT
jgi:hypothetical protein